MKTFHHARVVIFKTMAEAMASSYLIGQGDIAMVEGDPASVRIATGFKVSFDTPPNPTAKTYSQCRPLASSTGSFVNSYAANATQTLTAAELAYLYITSISAAPTTLTLDTATNIAALIGATEGNELDFEIDNSAGANVVTVAVGAGISVPGTVVITGSNTLTVAAGAFGKFKLIFKSATTALIYRML